MLCRGENRQIENYSYLLEESNLNILKPDVTDVNVCRVLLILKRLITKPCVLFIFDNYIIMNSLCFDCLDIATAGLQVFRCWYMRKVHLLCIYKVFQWN